MIAICKQRAMSCWEEASFLSAYQHHNAAGAGELLLTKKRDTTCLPASLHLSSQSGTASHISRVCAIRRSASKISVVVCCNQLAARQSLLPGRENAVMALQGSTLSSLLCCIYLAHLETEHLLPLLPQAAWHSSCTSAASSVAPRLTDLALAAGEERLCPRKAGSHAEGSGMSSWKMHTHAARCSQSQGAASDLPPLGLHLQLHTSQLLHSCSQFPWRCRQPQRHLRTGAHARWLVAPASGGVTTQQRVRWGWSAQGQEQAAFQLCTAGARAGARSPSQQQTSCHNGASHRPLRPHLDSSSRPHWCRRRRAGCSRGACWGSCRVATSCSSMPAASRGTYWHSWRSPGCRQGASAAVPADQAVRRLPVCHALSGSGPGAGAASAVR